MGKPPLPEEAGVAPTSAEARTPKRLPTTGNTEEGPVTPSCSRSGARSGPDHRFTSGPYVGGYRRGDHCPTYVNGGAAGAREPEAEAFRHVYLQVR